MLAGVGLMPHGNPVLEPPDEDTRRLADVLKKIGRTFAGVDSYVLISPHNARMSEHLGVILAENLVSWLGFEGKVIPGEWKTDRELAEKIYREEKDAGMPVVDLNFASLSGEYSRWPLSWGELIPLQFLERKPLVLMTPARNLSREMLVKFGETLGDIIEVSGKKVALIISADHGHAHDEKGPYGYRKESETYDRLIMELINENRLEELLKIPEELVRNALVDSYWQMLIMLGAMRNAEFELKDSAYACPTYFGMAGALWVRKV
ncbi:DODA-type extradiol aromatic ring-opening family dioxygenase [Thermococcus thioreducens]|uniref:Dioxygenase n=1 Tax=Thermococcus thioreducens TaxID=277988 RepID=A0A0Q2URV3_9EURY|nr:extradiol dioxygenase [Thermococcus thioreducens]ASJ13241.1 extradiol dioxygenase [Thermococcus thioreducens]KQH83344.1 dioxygenase [Thermococcus thioreducens]SEW21411.1 Aromatic ring-opening dioxygenase, LigB subunit [Thermococcus thioreducens]